MTDKFDKNSDLKSTDQEELLSDNYAANLNRNDQGLYIPPKSHRHFKFWFFSILVVFILVLSGSRFKDNIFEPLKFELPEDIEYQLTGEEDTKTLDELRASDTDQDGLSDYQERYQYYTSIFLPDTDSDGYTDAEEVNIGEDPLCPIGQSCNLLRLITPNTSLASIIDNITLDSDLTVQKAAVIEFRKFLEENGMSKEDLDTLEDADLLAIFRIVDESNILDSEQLNTSTTPEQIKEFLLLLPGSDEDEINAMSDEELIAVAEDLINQ